MALIRLDRFISERTEYTRSEIKQLVKKGSVSLDGATVKASDVKIDPEASVVTVCGNTVGAQKYRYILLNKPDGYVCSTDEKDGKTVMLPGDTPVSMNLWGLTPDIFGVLEEEYKKFLATADLTQDEFFIPSVISKAVDTGRATVRVFKNADKWYGITYREDLQEVKDAIGGYVHDGLYEGL